MTVLPGKTVHAFLHEKRTKSSIFMRDLPDYLGLTLPSDVLP